ncbi:transglycosylase SLT domain-containing protein [Flavobacterium sp.]|uniref:transglycosylase SLT domain-containing protein n=1 Tax=Flavobacterium sp. TaxID=239 RepID=UPI0026090DC0|nr:transglycosylase SLT domain-containing protein [Flavobacterium sp.]
MLSDILLIQQSTSPSQVFASDGGQTYALQIQAHDIRFCNQPQFPLWSDKNLKGKELHVLNGQLYIKLGAVLVNLRQLLARNGFLYDRTEVNAVVMAAAERQGEWACASKDAVFALIINHAPKAKAMAAIAMNESQYGGYPWPWTLNIQGKSYYFKTREEAYQRLRKSVADGIQQIDIGICQVNWKYNGARFQNLWEALDPSKNIEVSNQILTELYERHRSWSKAIACYHNCSDEVRGARYVNRYIENWNNITKSKGSDNANS